MRQPLFYSIESKSIKKFFILDIMVGTGLYYICKSSFSNEVAGIVGSIIGTEGIRRFPYKMVRYK